MFFRKTETIRWRRKMNGEALIISDMLNDFVYENGALYFKQARRIVPFVRERLEAHRRAGHPVIFLQDAHAPDDKEFEKFPPHCVVGTWGSQVISELAPQPGETLIPKTRYSGFFRTDLERALQATGVEQVEIVGVCTSICVMDTVGGLADRDYRIRVPAAGVADFDPEMHAFALRRMKQIYGAQIV
jgi:nicotinamidase-related amidase